MNSVWSDSVQLPQFETLQRDRKTDVLIIGGGMAGILCAYFLQEKGVDYMLMEGRRIGYKAEIVEVPELPFRTAGAVAFPRQAQFHPLKFAAQIARGLAIYENTFVTEFKEHTAVTEKGNIVYKKLIFATHFPIDNKHGMYFMKMYQERSYVLGLSGAAQV